MLGIKNKIILLDYTFLVVKRLINIFLRIFIYLIFSREKKNDFIFLSNCTSVLLFYQKYWIDFLKKSNNFDPGTI